MNKFTSFILITLLYFSTINNTYAQRCNDNVLATTPSIRFEILGNGNEIRDIGTGLIWQRCSLGQVWDGNTCAGRATQYKWPDALKEVKALGNGYRLPNIKELKTIVERRCLWPAVNLTIFPNVKSTDTYWSSSPNADFRNYGIWIVRFNEGDNGGSRMYDMSLVRAVRSE